MTVEGKLVRILIQKYKWLKTLRMGEVMISCRTGLFLLAEDNYIHKHAMGNDIGYKCKISNIYQTMHNKAVGFTTTYTISAYHH